MWIYKGIFCFCFSLSSLFFPFSFVKTNEKKNYDKRKKQGRKGKANAKFTFTFLYFFFKERAREKVGGGMARKRRNALNRSIFLYSLLNIVYTHFCTYCKVYHLLWDSKLCCGNGRIYPYHRWQHVRINDVFLGDQ